VTKRTAAIHANYTNALQSNIKTFVVVLRRDNLRFYWFSNGLDFNY